MWPVNSLIVYVAVAVALLVIVAVVVSLTLVGGRRHKPSLPPLPRDDAPAPLEVPSGDVTVLAPPELDRPEPAAGRLERLRDRLSRSQGMGKGLLALLSRDKLDEQTWD
jgi:fused signal recognition particle receptor